MPLMPYALEKGATFDILESYLDDWARRIEALDRARDITIPLWENPAFLPPNFPPVDNGATHPETVISQHVRDHWLGTPSLTVDPTTGESNWEQPVPETAQTGWFENWHGDAETITRQTMIRAVEISIGIKHDGAIRTTDRAPQPPADRSCWPIEILTICGPPIFQGWVTWRQHTTATDRRDTHGQVTVVFTTPPFKDPAALAKKPWLYSGVLSEDNPAPSASDYVVGPDSQAEANYEQGIWVVGHTGGMSIDPTTQKPTPTGAVPDPNAFYIGTGPIETVRITEVDGGVRPKPRVFH